MYKQEEIIREEPRQPNSNPITGTTTAMMNSGGEATNTTEASTPKPFGSNGTVVTCRRGAQGSILLVALNRPELRNAIDDRVYEDLTKILRQCARDPTVSAVVLTGCGPYFSSGADLKSNTNGFVPEKGGRHSLFKPVGSFMMEIVSFPKLLAAAVNGPVSEHIQAAQL